MFTGYTCMWVPLSRCSQSNESKQNINMPFIYLPTFFWDISVRFLSWECWHFWRRYDHFWTFPKKSEVFRKSPKFSEDVRSLPKASSLPVLFTSKIRDREEGIVIYSFYTWFSFLTWVWVNIFLEIVSSKTATTHNQAWEIGPQAWASVRSKFSTHRRETHA